jgi:hypothetical protein
LEKFYENEESSWKNTNDHHARAKKELAAQLLTLVKIRNPFQVQ